MAWISWIFIGSLFGASSVAAGAFGAHFLKHRLSAADLANFELAARYQLFHALALFGVALVANHIDNIWIKFAGTFFVLGTLLFSGSLYLITLTAGSRFLYIATPIGGSLLILAWLCLAASTLSAFP